MSLLFSQSLLALGKRGWCGVSSYLLEGTLFDTQDQSFLHRSSRSCITKTILIPSHPCTHRASKPYSIHTSQPDLPPSHSLTRAPPILPRKQHTPISPPPPQHLPKPPRAPPTPAHLAEISSAAGTLLLPSRRYASQCLTRWARLSSRREAGFSSASGAGGAWVAKVCRARDGDACSAIYRLLKESLRGGRGGMYAPSHRALLSCYLSTHTRISKRECSSYRTAAAA